MNDVWKAIAELCLEVHSERVDAIASGISGISGVADLGKTRESFGPHAGKELFRRLRDAWGKADTISPAEIAAGLRSASMTASLRGAQGSVELVWSGPSDTNVPVRLTEEVICEIVESSKLHLFVVSFAVYRIERVLKCLEAAVARGVQVDVLLEAPEKDGGKLSTDSFALFRNRLPSVQLWTWGQDDTHPLEPTGAVHAKCVVADTDQAFVTSANLTSAAMNRNIEVGIVIRGGIVPQQLSSTFQELIERKVLQRAHEGARAGGG